MCNNIRKIYNRYTDRELYVKCGKCEACQQEKADRRASRIKAHMKDGYKCLFVHLTYADAYLPYINMKDLYFMDDDLPLTVPVYRKHVAYWFYNRHIKESVCCSTLNDSPIDLFQLDYNKLTPDEYNKLHDVGNGRVGVLYYKDVQNFFKNLRSSIQNNAKYNKLLQDGERLSMFVCGEYGETFSRPHWHILLFVPENAFYSLELWQELICRNWLFAFLDITNGAIEEAICSANYVSEYVNCSADISSFLLRGQIRPCWHHSNHFGFALDSFQLDNVLHSLDNENITYNKIVPDGNGCYLLVAVPLPRYVLDTYFPRFKSLFRLSYQEIFSIIENPRKIYYSRHLTLDECHSIYIRLINCYEKYFKPLSLSYSDFAYYYCKAMRLRQSFINSQFYGNQVDIKSILQSYDNISDIVDDSSLIGYGLVYVHPSLPLIHDDLLSKYAVNPNNFDEVQFMDKYYRERFFKKVKQKKLNQYAKNFGNALYSGAKEKVRP